MAFYRTILAIIILGLSWRSYAQQVEHNYLVGPKNVTCDSLVLPSSDIAAVLIQLKEATYRYSKKFRLTRKIGLQGGEFYSCDGVKGYLIVRFDNQEVLYMNFSKVTWEFFTTSSNPEGYYLENSDQWEKYQ